MAFSGLLQSPKLGEKPEGVMDSPMMSHIRKLFSNYMAKNIRGPLNCGPAGIRAALLSPANSGPRTGNGPGPGRPDFVNRKDYVF